MMTQQCGRSSGVERNLAKVEVVSSNLIARSKSSTVQSILISHVRPAAGSSADLCISLVAAKLFYLPARPRMTN